MKQTASVAVKRLTRLADFLETVDDSKFDLGNWAHRSTEALGLGRRSNVPMDFLDSIKRDCGTTACAFGWAATVPEFRRLGLKFDPDFNGAYGHVIYEHDGARQGSGVMAASMFFCVDYDTAAHMFMPGEYPSEKRSRKDVILRIREVVARLDPKPIDISTQPSESLKLSKIDLKQSKTRLQTLVNRIKAQPNKKFDMRTIGTTHGTSWSASSDTKVATIGNPKVGTTANAAGLAGTIPAFRKLGLQTVAVTGLGSELTVQLTNPKNLNYSYNGISAVMNFFKLSLNEARYIFDYATYNPKYVSKVYVVRRIESHIKKIDKKLIVLSTK